MTDHGRVSLELAIKAAKQPEISFACENPAAQQAEIFPWNRFVRRHPYPGPPPEWSGYCVNQRCACDCHHNEAQDEIELIEA